MTQLEIVCIYVISFSTSDQGRRRKRDIYRERWEEATFVVAGGRRRHYHQRKTLSMSLEEDVVATIVVGGRHCQGRRLLLSFIRQWEELCRYAKI